METWSAFHIIRNYKGELISVDAGEGYTFSTCADAVNEAARTAESDRIYAYGGALTLNPAICEIVWLRKPE